MEAFHCIIYWPAQISRDQTTSIYSHNISLLSQRTRSLDCSNCTITVITNPQSYVARPPFLQLISQPTTSDSHQPPNQLKTEPTTTKCNQLSTYLTVRPIFAGCAPGSSTHLIHPIIIFESVGQSESPAGNPSKNKNQKTKNKTLGQWAIDINQSAPSLRNAECWVSLRRVKSP
jgi:hypothetical protein